jgi:hypothetical protein
MVRGGRIGWKGRTGKEEERRERSRISMRILGGGRADLFFFGH